MKRIYVKEEACIACRLCEVYCQVEHSQSKDLVKTFKKEHPQPLPFSRLEERKPVSFSVRCFHCDEPACVYACLTGALQKNPETGVVTVDTEKCVGCWTCILACQFGAIRQDLLQGKMAKCDLCPGKDVPVCVSNCPNEALVYAEIESDVPQIKG
ncbi:MAG: 4Fe-4S dicluster domain-containing protein [Chloroflexi bacterium]|nr:4Fe-4S dicluster domain-containing protein [Chloroflexota bacterium]